REKVFHPRSRKAGKLERAALRTSKLATQTSVRSKQQTAKVDRAGFFYLALPPDVPSLTLEELHELVSSVWITRHNEAIKAEESRRRKGEPRRPREVALREQQLRDVEEYRTGLELPDLTDESTVALFRQWGGVDTSYLHLLRTIRISSSNTKMVQVVKCG
ncbi:translation machinery-associated protein 16, partial [Cantharellus anzutake]|uniref:translation machinery-associated protein 16 n=1 Tax=Cantharellus anzutake TaxID=1750568 RepID=UPI001904F00B